MTDLRIASVWAWEALDSRGNPTVGCVVKLAAGVTGQATVPSGASIGKHEARELRDGEERYGGLGVTRAVRHVRDELQPAVVGLEVDDQERLDATLRAVDGTPDLSRLGANAILAVSVATAIAAANALGEPLYRTAGTDQPIVLPLPMVNIISGGIHAGWLLDIQDFLAVPIGAQTFAEALEWVWRVRRSAASILTRNGFAAALVADEGGLAAPLATNREALELLTRSIGDAGLTPGEDVGIAIDVAATQLRHGDGYRLASDDRTLSADEVVDELSSWAGAYPLVSIEDPLAEDDWSGWQAGTAVLGHLQLVGDDLFATNLDRLERGIEAGVANAVLVKPNQAGTLSSAKAVAQRAHAVGYSPILSARSGDTEESWLADLAVGWQIPQIKVGSMMRSERTAKWNRLLQIGAELGENAVFAGKSVLAQR